MLFFDEMSESNRCGATAVPYEEDDRDPTIWFLDHSYLENMFRMFKKVNGECQHHFESHPADNPGWL